MTDGMSAENCLLTFSHGTHVLVYGVGEGVKKSTSKFGETTNSDIAEFIEVFHFLTETILIDTVTKII